MNYLPYRDIEGDFHTGGKLKRTRRPWVYKEDYDRVLKNMNLWKKAFQISFWINCAVIFGELFGSWIIDKVGTDIIFIAFGVAFVVTWGYSLHKQYKERQKQNL